MAPDGPNTASASHTIGLLFANPADRRLLVDFVTRLGHRPFAPASPNPNPETWPDVDLIIADQPAASRYRETLLALKARSKTVFLPVLVAVPLQANGAAWLHAGFDDLLRLPLVKAELGARLSTFLRLRRQSAVLAEQSQAMYRALVEQSLVGVYLIVGTRFLYVNQALAGIFGYTPDEIVGRLGPLDLTHPDDHALVQENIRQRFSGQVEASHYILKGRRKDGEAIICEVFGRRIDYQGRPAILGTLVDITERVRAEEELRQYRDRLEDKVWQRTAELRKMVNAMAGREVRMAELKQVIRKLRAQLKEAGLVPVANDPLLEEQPLDE